ncbi:class I SAM-dependent methyltransferase [Bacillus sp. AF53]|uniref:class I SAM-dependent methyltransferase n=1 Tax=Bacillus sp. AF53 TaxID=3158958 RepID=UPI002A511903|nr:class I SAM-dependent methyltransferase [Bacillus cereus]
MHDNKFFGPFKKKLDIPDVQILDEVYLDEDFVTFYNQELNKDDLEMFKNILAKDDVILEIGSGSGRIFNPLSKQGFNIYGIEPSQEMTSYILSEYRHKIFNIRVQDTEELREMGISFSKIIIPATTISLFSHEDFESFVMTIKELLDEGGSIIFDFINPDSLDKLDGKVNISTQKGKKIFFANYLSYPHFILNVYLQGENQKKLGYSVKNVYSLEILNEMCERNNYSLNVLVENNVYLLVEMRKNGAS